MDSQNTQIANNIQNIVNKNHTHFWESKRFWIRCLMLIVGIPIFLYNAYVIFAMSAWSMAFNGPLVAEGVNLFFALIGATLILMGAIPSLFSKKLNLKIIKVERLTPPASKTNKDEDF
jgi:hypothetical protein